MERKFYKQGDNGVWVEAPDSYETADGLILNYNSEANEAMLRADGYLPEDEINYFNK